MVTQWIMALTSYGCGLLAPPKKNKKEVSSREKDIDCMKSAGKMETRAAIFSARLGPGTNKTFLGNTLYIHKCS